MCPQPAVAAGTLALPATNVSRGQAQLQLLMVTAFDAGNGPLVDTRCPNRRERSEVRVAQGRMIAAPACRVRAGRAATSFSLDSVPVKQPRKTYGGPPVVSGLRSGQLPQGIQGNALTATENPIRTARRQPCPITAGKMQRVRSQQEAWGLQMDSRPTRGDVTIPADRWRIREMSLESVDFARQAADAFSAIATDSAVAFDFGVNERGEFIDLRTGVLVPEVIDRYSRMKHGALDEVSFFAGHVAATALRSERFRSLMRNGVANERVIYLTTAAVFAVPSASNLLLRATAEHLNIMLATQGMAPVVVAEQTRLSTNSLGYTCGTVRERRDELSAGRGVTIVPEQFRDQSVVFLDDLFSTGYTAYRADRRLTNVEVADRFFLFAARIDPQAVGASHGQIEDRLNDYFVTGTLQSVAPMLQLGNFAVVQKLLKVVLAPEHTDQLSEFLQEVPTPSILKLCTAAACDGLRHKSQGRYSPSLLILEMVLRERGALDAEGRIVDPLRDRD